MKITLSVYTNREPGQTLDDLMKLPMKVAAAFAETLNQEHLKFITGFDVACDTEQTEANNKTIGVPYELLKQLSEELKSK